MMKRTQHANQVANKWLASIVLDGTDDGADMHDIECADEVIR